MRNYEATIRKHFDTSNKAKEPITAFYPAYYRLCVRINFFNLM